MTTTLPPVDVAVLGPVLVRSGDGLVPVRGARSRGLLVSLALHAGHPVGVDVLTDELWPQEQPASPRAALQNVVSRARRDGAPVRSTAGGYVLDGATDLDVARDAARSVVGAPPHDAIGALHAALALWRGEPGTDLEADHVGLVDDLLRVSESLRTALEHDLLDALVAAEDPEALALGERLGERDPSDERVALAGMTALARAGRATEALRVFARTREALADTLGADPGPALRAMNEQVLRAGSDPVGVHGRAAGATPSSRSSSAPTPADATPPARPERRTGRAIGLRAAPNALLGRAEDVTAIEESLAAARVVTVLGPGGLGKTRIAQEVAHRAARTSPLVVVVELASLRSADDVGLAIASALGVRDIDGTTRLGDRLSVPDTRARVLEQLGVPGALLVLDNCEHVLDGVTDWVVDVVGGTGATVLLTSRAPLGVPAEVVHPLRPLTSAAGRGGRGSAVELFEQRARAARPGVDLPDDVVRRLCDRLDGLPLAIELAAARVRSLSVAEIERRIASRFAFLTSSDRSAPERHRTLHAVIEWSWNLLGRTEQALLRRVAALPSSFALDAAVAVGSFDLPPADRDEDDVLDRLDALVAQSMLGVVEDPATGAVRYRMLETVREFSALELAAAGEEATAAAAVGAWAVALACTSIGDFSGPGQREAMARVRVEQENLLQVLRRGIDARDLAVAGPVFGLLARAWIMRAAVGEVTLVGQQVAAAMVGRPVAAQDAGWAVWVLVCAANPIGSLLDESAARRAAGRLHRLLRRHDVELTTTTRAFGEALDASVFAPEQAEELFATMLASGSWTVAMTANLFGAQIAENEGRLADGVVHARRAIGLASAHGDRWSQGAGEQSLAELWVEQREPREALRWVTRSRASFEGFDADQFQRQLDSIESSALVALGRLDEAEPVLRAMLETPDDPDVREPGSSSDDLIFSPRDLRITGGVGLAQIAFARGDARGALARAEHALAELRARQDQGTPQSRILHVAHRLGLAVLDAAKPGPDGPASTPQEREGWARDLRARARAVLRLGGRVDRPVLGAACAALGAYLATAGLGRGTDAAELLDVARRMGSRQDWLGLDRVALRAAAGIADDGAAGAGTGGPVDGATLARVLELLDVGPWHR